MHIVSTFMYERIYIHGCVYACLYMCLSMPRCVLLQNQVHVCVCIAGGCACVDV